MILRSDHVTAGVFADWSGNDLTKIQQMITAFLNEAFTAQRLNRSRPGYLTIYTGDRRITLDSDLIRMQRIFREVLEDDSFQLAPGDSDATVPGWDSFAHVKLIIGLEEEFGVKFSIDEVAETKQVAGLREIIARNTSA